MSVVNEMLLRRFLVLAGERLRGVWVLLGGALLPTLGVSARVTLDIDLVGPSDSSNQDNLILFGIAEDLGLPIEAVNQAPAFFLRRIDGHEAMLLPLHQGKQATIMRPTVTLFVLLKLRRLSETDLEDCLAMLDHADALGDPIDKERLLAAVTKRYQESTATNLRERLSCLSDAIRDR